MSSPFDLGVDAQAVEVALNDYLAHPDEGAGELLRFAQLHHVLPLWTDWVGCIALRPTGQLVFFSWDDPPALAPQLKRDPLGRCQQRGSAATWLSHCPQNRRSNSSAPSNAL